jgi:hypothetical protein
LAKLSKFENKNCPSLGYDTLKQDVDQRQVYSTTKRLERIDTSLMITQKTNSDQRTQAEYLNIVRNKYPRSLWTMCSFKGTKTHLIRWQRIIHECGLIYMNYRASTNYYKTILFFQIIFCFDQHNKHKQSKFCFRCFLL